LETPNEPSSSPLETPNEQPSSPLPLDGTDTEPLLPTEVSSQDMVQSLMSQYNFAQQLVEI
ncbi:MAG: hypothetical protein LBU27_05195, partial [Candidatus Peribacteria bacterium]|nr:hypothetical protein [Candidatus Peribacteria bacterium]